MKFSGRLADFSLPDVLRIIIQSHKMGYLVIQFKGSESYIYVKQGALQHAESEGLTGENAIFHLMSYDSDAEFEFVETQELPAKKTIQSDLDTLLQKGIDYLETWRKVAKSHPRFTINTEIILLSSAQENLDPLESQIIQTLSPDMSKRLYQIVEHLKPELVELANKLESLENKALIQIIGEERIELKRFFIEASNTLYSEFESISGMKLKQEIQTRLEKLIQENNWKIDLQNGRIVGDKIRTDTMEEQKLLYGQYLSCLIGLISPIYGTTFIQQVMNKVEQHLTVPIQHWIKELNLKV